MNILLLNYKNYYNKLLCICLAINVGFFIYYCYLPNINPSNDMFYYIAIADSLYNGTGFYDITSSQTQPIITPQNGVVFLHLLLKWSGFHDSMTRLLVLKVLNYLGFLSLLLVLFKSFKELKVSLEVTSLCMGIILLSADFLKTIILPLNDGIFCILTAVIFYLVIEDETKYSFIKIAIIIFLSIMIANFRLNGPLIILSAAIAYFLLRMVKKSLIYFIIFCISYASVYLILIILHVDVTGIKELASRVYSIDYFINQALMTLVFTIPGAFMGISGRVIMIGLPISLGVLTFYVYYFLHAMKEESFTKIYIIIYIMLSISFLQIMPGGPSRYIIMIMPFSYLIAATFIKDNSRLRIALGIILLITLSISLFRVVFWDSVFFTNKESLRYAKEKIVKPYVLISEDPRYTYYILDKRADSMDDITHSTKLIVIFGNKKYVRLKIKEIKGIVDVGHIEYFQNKFIIGHSDSELYEIVKISVN